MYRIDKVDVKNNIGNGEAKELTCTTQGHELRRGGADIHGKGELGEGGKWGKNWDNCNRIVNRIYLKDKERILKSAREKQLVTYRGVPVRLS